jgi:type IV secretion system protein VirB10
MRGLASTVLIFVGLIVGPAGPPASALAIGPGTRVALRLETALTTRTARPGYPVRLRTIVPITVRGQLIPSGSEARGVVGHARRPGRVRGRAQLTIHVDAIATADGTWLTVAAWSPTLEPAWTPSTRRVSYDDPQLPVLAGMAAGYGVAGLVSKWSTSEETVAHSGMAAGVATIVLIGVLKRGPDLMLPPGTPIPFDFEDVGGGR